MKFSSNDTGEGEFSSSSAKSFKQEDLNLNYETTVLLHSDEFGIKLKITMTRKGYIIHILPPALLVAVSWVKRSNSKISSIIDIFELLLLRLNTFPTVELFGAKRSCSRKNSVVAYSFPLHNKHTKLGGQYNTFIWGEY